MAQLPVAHVNSPLPSFSLSAGFPSAIPMSSAQFLRSPLPGFASNGPAWANPLTIIPIQPLPTNGSGGGAIGYAF